MSDDIVQVKVFLSRLPNDNAAAGFLGFLDFMGESLNPNGHHKGRIRSWWTHFAMQLTCNNGDIFCLERKEDHDGGVVYKKVRADYFVNEAPSVETIEWVGMTTKEEIERFINEEKYRGYNIFDNNCQHFSWIFFRNYLHDERAMGDFEWFTEQCQEAFVDATD